MKLEITLITLMLIIFSLEQNLIYIMISNFLIYRKFSFYIIKFGVIKQMKILTLASIKTI